VLERTPVEGPSRHGAGVADDVGEGGPVTLDRLAVGSPARVIGVSGDAIVRRRLLEMGLVPGTPVTVLRRAPFGDPIEVSAHGYLLSLRLDEARRVATER
jgi:Fe2+ transport system protein FeoA